MSLPLDDVERRVLGHLPAWRNEKAAAHAARLETSGHTAKERSHLLTKTETEKYRKQLPDELRDDPRLGTSEDPRIVHGCGHHIDSYTLEELTARLRRDEHLRLSITEAASRATPDQDLVIPAIAPDWVRERVHKLSERGLAAIDNERCSMTKAGLAALTA